MTKKREANNHDGHLCLPVREKSPERCAIARQNLKSISENARVRIKENGEFRYLNEKEVNAKRQEARQTVKEDC